MSAKRRRLIYVLIALIISLLAALSCQPPPPPDMETVVPTTVLSLDSTIIPSAEIAPTADSSGTEGNFPAELSTPELTHSLTGETPPFSETPTLTGTATATATITPTVTGTGTANFSWPSPTRMVTLTPNLAKSNNRFTPTPYTATP